MSLYIVDIHGELEGDYEIIRKYEEPTTKNDLPHCQHTNEEIAKSFIEDVGAVKDQLPCGELMDFPNTFDEFAKRHQIVDKDEHYSNGIEYIPVFRVKQWLEHISTTKNDLGVDCISRADAIKAMQNKAKKLTNEDTINGLCGAVAILFELPSVTPQLSVPEVTALAEWIEKLTKASEEAYNKGYADGMKEQESRWIPVKTINQCYIPELKDYHGKVIATYLTGKHIKPQVTTVSISYGRIENKKYTDIVAIMYLPEPYREVEE